MSSHLETEQPCEPFGRAIERGPLKGLNSNVVKLGVVSFLTDVASEMLYPLVPIFLTSVLGAPMAIVGVIEGVADATASLLKAVSGKLSDRLGRRRIFVFAGYALSAIAKPMMALATGWPLILFARVADRFGKGVRQSPRDALLADSVSAQYRGRAFGWHRAMDTMGAVFGPLLALVLLDLMKEDLRQIFLIALIPGVLSAAMVFAVKEFRPRMRSALETSIAYKRLPPDFRKYLFAWGVFAVANSSDVFLIMKAKQAGFSTTAVVFAYALYNMIYAVGSPVLGQISDAIGRRAVLIGGLLVFALVYLGFAASTHDWQIWILFAVYGLYTAATDGVGKAFAVDLVPESIRAGALGLLGTVTGIAALAASTVAGALWSTVGSWAAFVYGAAGALIAAAMMFSFKAIQEKKA